MYSSRASRQTSSRAQSGHLAPFEKLASLPPVLGEAEVDNLGLTTACHGTHPEGVSEGTGEHGTGSDGSEGSGGSKSSKPGIAARIPHIPALDVLVGAVGIEPTTQGLKGPCSTD